MPVRKFKVSGEEILLDHNFNVYEVDTRKYIGRLVPSPDRTGLRILRGIGMVPDEADRTVEQERIFDSTKEIFNAKIKALKAAKAKTAEAPAPPSVVSAKPKRKIVISDEPEIDLDKEYQEKLERELREVKFHGHSIDVSSPLRGVIHSVMVRGKRVNAMFRGETLVPAFRDPRTDEWRPITEDEEEWLRENPGADLEDRMTGADYEEE
jgi:uncharacterized protein YfcZ (UPF0381/DUF406 family)